MMKIAVCGAHMEGLALHWQLREREARLVQRTTSAPVLPLLPSASERTHSRPARHGACERRRSRHRAGGVGDSRRPPWAPFLEGIGAPLGLGKVELADGTKVTGFICEGLDRRNRQPTSLRSGAGGRGWMHNCS